MDWQRNGLFQENSEELFTRCMVWTSIHRQFRLDVSWAEVNCRLEETHLSIIAIFDLTDKIAIGNNVRIGMCSKFITNSHEIGPSSMRGGKSFSAPIIIEDGSWIGAGVTILPGVKVGKRCVIAAGAVVTHGV